MNGLRTMTAGALVGLVAACAPLGVTAEHGSAAALRVDGGVLQVIVVEAPALPDVPHPVELPVVAPMLEARSSGLVADPAPVLPPTTEEPTEVELPEQTAPTEPTDAPEVHYDDCDAARADGAAPLVADDPGYRPELDPDADGIACAPQDPG